MSNLPLQIAELTLQVAQLLRSATGAELLHFSFDLLHVGGHVWKRYLNRLHFLANVALLIAQSLLLLSERLLLRAQLFFRL